MTAQPICPDCGEKMWREQVGEAVHDYIPVPPPEMAAYLALHGPSALVWVDYGCVMGNRWQPAC